MVLVKRCAKDVLLGARSDRKELRAGGYFGRVASTERSLHGRQLHLCAGRTLAMGYSRALPERAVLPVHCP